MKASARFIFALFAFFSGSFAYAAGDDGYEPVLLAARDTVSGKSLVIIAYAIIFVLTALYVGSIKIRERRVQKALRRLMNTIQSRHPKP